MLVVFENFGPKPALFESVGLVLILFGLLEKLGLFETLGRFFGYGLFEFCLACLRKFGLFELLGRFLGYLATAKTVKNHCVFVCFCYIESS